MKPRIVTLLIISALAHLCFSQVTYVRSLDISFSGGNNGSFSGNLAADVIPTIDAVEGVMNVSVNKINAQWSALVWYVGGGCWTKRLTLDQSNRYIEFRIKSDTAVTKPMKIKYVWGGCSGCCSETKNWQVDSFTIPKADVWQTVFFKIKPTTGGTQNILDTLLDRSFAIELENGSYQIDYFKLGDAAVPPKPILDATIPKTKIVCSKAGEQTINLSGISIPNRFIDGLTITAESLSSGILSDIGMHDLGSGPFAVDVATNVATAALHYTPVIGMTGMGDSIIITLKDTIRGTINKTSFFVNLISCETSFSLNDPENNIKIYPTATAGMVTIETAEPITDIIISDIMGTVVAVRKIASTEETIDISGFAPGIYIVKASDGKSYVSKKIIRL